MSNQAIISKYNAYIKDDISILDSSLNGVNTATFFDFVSLSGINKVVLAEKIMDISFKTIQRYKQEKKLLNAQKSELLLKLLALYKKGNEIFGSTMSFNNWLNKPAYGIGSRVPFVLLSTTTGIDLIFDELIRIEFGAFA